MGVDLKTRVEKAFRSRYGGNPAFVVQAPGRVNLIGEHTDYNDGFVLPMAIDRAVTIALRPRVDDRVVLHSLEIKKPSDFSLDVDQRSGSWGDYVRGMAWVLRLEGYPLRGWEGILSSDIPIGSGLSSSAALELAVARAFWALTRWDWDKQGMALAARKMENEWLELKSGIMDQMISACGQEGQALLIDCRDLSTIQIPLPEGYTVIVLDTAVRRGLVDSAYNERVDQCAAAAEYFRVTKLRDVSTNEFNQKADGMDDVVRRRARHVIYENERTLQAVEAMRAGDVLMLGRLINASHASLRDDYQVSSFELDTIVEIAREREGCIGARMIGGGFGGCAIALVEDQAVEGLVATLPRRYTSITGLEPHVFPVTAAKGAGEV
jgi:galactokinase